MDERANEKRFRHPIDWEGEAFAVYLAEGTCAGVARHFGVSVRTVETHCARGRWRQRRREVQQEAAQRSRELLVDEQVQKVQRIEELIDASLLEYSQRLRDGMRMTPADLERLYRLWRNLIDVRDETTSAEAAASAVEPPERTIEHAHAVITALAEAGALEAFGLTYTPVETTETNTEGADG
jgi:transposase